MAEIEGGSDVFPWSSVPVASLLRGAVDEPTTLSSPVHSVLQKTLGQVQLPIAKSASLYYIRAVKNDKHFGGEDKEYTILVPEFLFVFDLGYPAKAGVLCPWRASGSGDPGFPDFSRAVSRAIYRETTAGLIYPAIAGDLLISTQPGTPQAEVEHELKNYVDSVKYSSTDLYLAKVKPFHEREVAGQVEQEVPFVRYAEVNSIVRRIDFVPGWRCTKVL